MRSIFGFFCAVCMILVLGSILISSSESRRIHGSRQIPFADEPRSTGPRLSSQEKGILTFSACGISRDNCGSITPNYYSIFIADGAYNSIDGTIFFIDVASGGGGAFQLDPATCSIVPGTYFPLNEVPFNDRAIAFDPNRYQIWAGGWNLQVIKQHDATPPYELISETFLDVNIASAAIDPVNDYLFVAANNAYDWLYVYDISSGELGEMLGSWWVAWQQGTDGFDMAGMAFDDDSGQLVFVNQYLEGPGHAVEVFDFDVATGLTPAGYCTLDVTRYAWGIGLIEDGNSRTGTFYSYNPDIDPQWPPFFVDEYRIFWGPPHHRIPVQK